MSFYGCPSRLSITIESSKNIERVDVIDKVAKTPSVQMGFFLDKNQGFCPRLEFEGGLYHVITHGNDRHELTGRETGGTITGLSSITDLDTSNVSRSHDAAR